MFSDPNGPAYQRTELRTGPPLSYVSEKLGNSLLAIHRLHRDLAGHPGSSRSAADEGAGCSERQADAFAAFRYAVTAYLALNNFLALANAEDFPERLLAMSRVEFEAWLEGIEREGSVRG